MTKLNDLDRQVLRSLLFTSNQGELAKLTGATSSAITHALTRLEAANLVELVRDPSDGRKLRPRLAILSGLERLEASVISLVSSTLQPVEAA